MVWDAKLIARCSKSKRALLLNHKRIKSFDTKGSPETVSVLLISDVEELIWYHEIIRDVYALQLNITFIASRSKLKLCKISFYLNWLKKIGTMFLEVYGTSY